MTRAAAVAAIPGQTNYPTIKGPKAITAVEAYVAKAAQIKVLEDEVKQLRDYLLREMGEAPIVFVGARTVTRTDVPEQPALPARTITKEMLGQQIPGAPGRRGYSKLSVR